MLATGSVPYEAIYQAPLDSDSAHDPAWGLEYDPSQAIALLEDALGEDYGFETTCFLESGDEVAEAAALVIQADLAAVGITMEIQPVGGAIRGMKTSDGWGANNLMLADYSWSPIPVSSDLSWFNYHSSRMMCDTYISQDMKDLYDEMSATYDMSTLQTLHEDIWEEYRELSCGVLLVNKTYSAVFADKLSTTWLLPYDRYWQCNYDWLAD